MGTRDLRTGQRMGYPESATASRYGREPAPDLQAVVRSRHRAEAAEWLALFTVFCEESGRLDRESSGLAGRDHDYARIEAAEAACARWCVVAPMTMGSTRYRLKAAIQVFEHLPLVAEAFLEGEISAQLIQQIVSRTYGVDPRLCPGLDAALREMLVEPIAAGARFSARAVDAAVDEIVMLIDPDGVRTVRKSAQKGCRVGLDSLPGGVARLLAVLPAAAAVMVFNRVDRLARSLHAGRPTDADGIRLGLERCRAVALLLLVSGRGALSAAGEGPGLDEVVDDVMAGQEAREAEVSVMIHATQGAVESPSGVQPVWLPFVGLVQSEALAGLLEGARRHSPRAGPEHQVRPRDPLSWLTTPHSPPEEWQWEEIRDTVPRYALRYRIPEWLADKVRMRDGSCRFPGCGVGAQDCDVDHVRPFLHRDPVRGGWTIEANLGCLCRGHHRLKTHDRWTVTVDQNAVYTFTSPDGARACTYPSGPAVTVGLAEAALGEGLDDEPERGADGRAA